MVRTMSRWFELLGESEPSATRTPSLEQLGHPTLGGDSLRPLGGGDRAHRHRGAGPREALDLGVVEAQHVGQEHVGAEHPVRFEILGGTQPVPREGLPPRVGAASVVEREPGPVLVRQALEPAQEVGAAGLRRERHRPRSHSPVEAAVPLPDEGRRAGERLVGAVPGQRERGLPVRHALAEDHADARVLVRLEARVGELGAPGIDEANGAALEELDQAEQRRVVLLLLRHRHLEPEDVGQRAAHVVQEDAAHGVGVADVHVAVQEPGGHEQGAGVDRAVGGSVRQLGRLPDPADSGALDEDRAVLDDPPLAVQGDDVAGVLDLERPGSHGSAGSLRVSDPPAS